MVKEPSKYNLRMAVFSCLVVLVFLLSQVAFLTPPKDAAEAEEVMAEQREEREKSNSNQREFSVADKGRKSQYRSLGTYQVETGDSLYWIAGSYGISVEELKKLNGLSSEILTPGQQLVVPLDFLHHYPVGVRLSKQEVEWLAQMIHAEARGEPYLGQVAVGAVIINRMLSPQFPDTLRGVLFQRNAFQPIRNGSFYMTPNESARKAALEALNGHDPTGGALFFFNPRQSTDRFMHSRPTQTTIGRHRFTN